jgi:hypothetical protein
MEHCDLAEVYTEVKNLLNEFAKMWQGWGISVQEVSEKDTEGMWLLKFGGDVLRPLRISVILDQRSKDKLPWIFLGSNERAGAFKACKYNRRYLRSYFERLTEYLVLEAAQVPAIEKSKLYIRKSSKHLYLALSNEDDEGFWFSFFLRRNGWAWRIRRWVSGRGWVVIDRVYRPFDENPIEAFVNIISAIGLALL